ncbi:M6 family metalloprotease domain-containing protein [Zooshikella ganghwensis]|uniref:M6 family metalloprotease domain-containing protein n=1 Tax=Zooshikella ganghwensis TaxID=202772 RepID=A0A4P9VHN7_9GAMM|nr:M6 family metalloprotease domain-containing protein [Zooshikella ganghwensis]RDH41894.1 M6 family metalloprotease domain-containing protein [Zooshikella ganghwensis]
MFRIYKKPINSLILFVFIFCAGSIYASAFLNEKIKIKLPTGKEITIIIVGTEKNHRIESIDGYTLIYDASSKYYYYAMLSPDKTQLISSGIMYEGNTAPLSLSLPKHLNKPKSTSKRYKAYSQPRYSFSNNLQPIRKQLKGQIKGLTILIDFSDEPATISKEEIEKYLNLRGYTGYGNNGSIRDYWLRVSSQQLDYTNKVTDYYRAPKPKSYYLNCPTGVDCAKELVENALQHLISTGYDFSQLSTTYDKFYQVTSLQALNIFYAGSATYASISQSMAGTPNALWPSTGSTKLSVGNGIYATVFQKTNMGSELTIGTFCHENGHMLLNWPDLYRIPGHSENYDLMASGNYAAEGKNPTPPNPYFRVSAGWEQGIELNPALNPNRPVGALESTTMDNKSYKFSNPNNPREAFFVETLYASLSSGGYPENGLAVWHVNDRGNRVDCTTGPIGPNCNPTVVLKRANPNLIGNYLFRKNGSTQFNNFTDPSSKWWTGNTSGLQLTDVSKAEAKMCFTVDGSACSSTINTPPTVDVFAHTNTKINEASYFTVKVSDEQTLANNLTVSVTSAGVAATTYIYQSHGDIRYGVTQAQKSGNLTLTFTVTDEQGLSTTKHVTLNVEAISNTPPALELNYWNIMSLSRDRFINVPVQINDDNTPVNRLTLSAIVGNKNSAAAGLFTSSNGATYLYVQPFVTGIIPITVNATDEAGLTTSKTISIGVNN